MKVASLPLKKSYFEGIRQHLKWAFSEAAVLYLRGNDKAKNYLNKLQRRMSKGKALSALAHKIGRCVYFMLKDKTVFDEKKFLKG